MYVCVEEPEAITLSSEAVLRYYRGTIEAPLRYVGDGCREHYEWILAPVLHNIPDRALVFWYRYYENFL